MTPKAMRCVRALRICHSNEDCRDCEFAESDRDEKPCVNILFEDAADLIQSLSEQLEAAQPKWIGVEERLPGDPLDGAGEVVELLIDKGTAKEVLPGYYDHNEKDWVVYIGDISGVYLSKHFSWWNVTKWRSLSEPPKEEA